MPISRLPVSYFLSSETLINFYSTPFFAFLSCTFSKKLGAAFMCLASYFNID